MEPVYSWLGTLARGPTKGGAFRDLVCAFEAGAWGKVPPQTARAATPDMPIPAQPPGNPAQLRAHTQRQRQLLQRNTAAAKQGYQRLDGTPLVATRALAGTPDYTLKTPVTPVAYASRGAPVEPGVVRSRSLGGRTLAAGLAACGQVRTPSRHKPGAATWRGGLKFTTAPPRSHIAHARGRDAHLSGCFPVSHVHLHVA